MTGPDNEILSDGTYNYSYDADGNRIERSDIATGAVTDYVWDNRDRLVEVIDRSNGQWFGDPGRALLLKEKRPKPHFDAQSG